MEFEVVMWEWRDGSVHPEMQLVTMFNDDDELVTHLSGRHAHGLLKSACGISYFGVASSSGLGNPAKIDCPTCRSFIAGVTLKLDASLPPGTHCPTCHAARNNPFWACPDCLNDKMESLTPAQLKMLAGKAMKDARYYGSGQLVEVSK